MSHTNRLIKPKNSEPFVPDFISRETKAPGGVREARLGDIGYLVAFIPDDRIGVTGMCYLGINLNTLRNGPCPRAVYICTAQEARDAWAEWGHKVVEVVEGDLSFCGLHDLQLVDAEAGAHEEGDDSK